MELGSQEFLNLITAATLIVLIISVIIQFNQIRKQIAIQNDQIKTTLFTEYTKRYQEIMNSFPVDIWDNDFTYKKLSHNDQVTFLKTIRTYLDLCSEEYYLHINHKISDEVWIEWEKGIVSLINIPAIKEAWETVKSTNFYDDFVVFLNSKIFEAKE